MTIHHALSFPIKPYETATSYASRLTSYCGLISPTDLCLDFGFRWQDFIRGDDLLFEMLARIGGASATNLKTWAVRTVDHNRFEVCGQQATKATLVRSRIRVCPRCLVEDWDSDRSCGIYRRVGWHFWSIRTCAIHNVPIVLIPPEPHTIHNYHFVAQVQKNWRLIQKQADCAETYKLTELEDYILGRLDGKKNQPFLDGFPLYIAARLCEVLGFVLRFGPERKISEGTDNELRQAGQEGFAALRHGEDGLYTSLETLVSPIARHTVRHQSDFGAFFEWLRSSSLGAEFEPLKDMVRAFIFRTYPFRGGEMVLGKQCGEPAAFTIAGAWQAVGIQRARMNRYLAEEGFAAKDDKANAMRLKIGLNRNDIDVIARKLAQRLTAVEACEFLNIGVLPLRGLVNRCVVNPQTDSLDHVPKYDRRELVGLLHAVRANVTVAGGSTQLVTINNAATRAKCESAEILGFILAGSLPSVGWDERSTGLAAIRVDLDEVRLALPHLEARGVSKVEASQTLKVTYRSINAFLGDQKLTPIKMRNPKSRQLIDGVSKESIETFRARFVTLGHLSHCNRWASGPLFMHLVGKGILPVDTDEGLSRFYVRNGLSERLAKFGLKVPEPKCEGEVRA